MSHDDAKKRDPKDSNAIALAMLSAFYQEGRRQRANDVDAMQAATSIAVSVAFATGYSVEDFCDLIRRQWHHTQNAALWQSNPGADPKPALERRAATRIEPRIRARPRLPS
jgi:hypothetical protein